MNPPASTLVPAGSTAGDPDDGLPANTLLLIHKLGHAIPETRLGALRSLRSKMRHGLLHANALVHEVDLLVGVLLPAYSSCPFVGIPLKTMEWLHT